MALSSSVTVLSEKPWTLLSYCLVHQTILHLIIALALLSAIIVLRGVEAKAFWLLFGAGVVAGALAFLLLFPLTGFSEGALVGSSAGICALIPLAVYREFRHKGVKGGHPSAWFIVVVALVDFVSFFILSSPGFLAHIGGYGVGVAAMLVALRRDRTLLKRHRHIASVYSRAEVSGIASLSEEERDLLAKGVK